MHKEFYERQLELAEQQLLAPGGLDQANWNWCSADLMGPAVDSGDIYFQSTSHESWLLEDGLVRSGSHSAEQGVGIRAISGEKTGFRLCRRNHYAVTSAGIRRCAGHCQARASRAGAGLEESASPGALWHR